MVNHEHDVYDDERPRSIFSALWFRALLVVLVLGVIAAVALPYVLDFLSPSSRQAVKAAPRQAAAPAPSSAPPPPAAGSPPGLPSMGGSVATPAPPPAAASSAATPSASPTAIRPVPHPPKAAAPTPTAPAATGTTAVARRVATPPAKSMAPTAVRGSYWVQVGAFRSEETAKRVAAKLRDLSYEVHESTTQRAKTSPASAAPSGPSATDRYDVFVSGAAAAEVTAKLAAKGFAADAVAGGVVVKPSLPLRDAVALSRDLTADGLKVQVKRASGAAGASSASAAGGAGATLYRVRVGKFGDRASAQAAAKELEAKGYKGFIARGPE